MNKWMKRSSAILLASAIGISVAPAPVQSASILETALGGATAMIYVEKQLRRMDDEGQSQILKSTQAKTGYYDNADAQARVRAITDRIEGTPDVKRKYAVYVNPEEDFNAFMTIGGVMSFNKGALDKLDDDALAYVVGHEIAHGEHRDVINGLRRSIGTQTLVQIATAGAGIGGEILGDLATNYIDNQVFTMAQEKTADKDGFKHFTAAGYNPGGAAAAMAILRDEYGDTYREGLVSVLAPNNHPKTSTRVTENVKRMKEYSGNRVDVKDNTVYVNNKPIYAPPAAGVYTSEVRAYIMAGKLAKLYHDNQINSANVIQDGTVVYVGDTRIVGAESESVAAAIRDSLASAVASK